MSLGGLKIAFTGLFVYAAMVQVNDPDALLWIAIYVAAATVSGVSIFYHYHPSLSACVSLICIGWASLILPSALDMSMSFAHEEPREFLGLGIIIMWTGWLTVHHRRLRSADELLPYIKS